jgi:hypothetical protein
MIRSIAVAIAVLALTACGGGGSKSSSSSSLPQGTKPVKLDPADFTTNIDNPYWPMKVGSRWVYSEGKSKVVVTVTDQTKEIANGITARVVHDVVSEDGKPVEVTSDWYAQDSDGNIWYMGEDTAEYENGKVSSRAGSFEAGVDGAQPGIITPGDPQPGVTYREEYLKGEAEDYATVVSLDAHAESPFGNFDGALKTRNVNPLDKPQGIEEKFYAKGVGPVLVLSISPAGGSSERLLSYTEG